MSKPPPTPVSSLLRHKASVLFASFALATLAPSKECVSTACVSLSGQLASVDSTESPILDVVAGQLLGTDVTLSAAEWDALGTAQIDLVQYLDLLALNAGLGGAEEVIAADFTLLELSDAAVDVLNDNGEVAAADALEQYALSLPIGSINLGELLEVCLDCGPVTSVQIDALDLITGSALVLNNSSAVSTPEPITIQGSALGLESIVENISIATAGTAPVIYCGPEGTQAYGATQRVYLNIDLVDTDLGAALSAAGLTLPLGVDLSARIGELDLYIDIAQAEANIQAIDAETPVVEVAATPGVANIYLGYIDPELFFDLDRPIDANSDLSQTTIGDLSLDLLGIPVDVLIKASAFAEGTAPLQELLTFLGPYPEYQTAGSSSEFIEELLTTLLTSLELTLEVDSLATLDPITQTLLDQTLATLLPLLGETVPGVISPPLETVFIEVVDPLLALLGIGIGEVDVAVLGAETECSYQIEGYVYLDNSQNGTKENDEKGTGLALFAKLVDAGAPDSPALLAAPIDPSTGRFLVSPVTEGDYLVFIDDNNNLTDTDSYTPPGYFYTESENGIRFLSLTGPADITSVNFGLYSGRTLQALAFYDTGTGGATAHDGVKSGAESSYAELRWELVLESDGSLLDSGASNSNGEIRAVIPGNIADGEIVCLKTYPKSTDIQVSESSPNPTGTFADSQYCFALEPGADDYTDIVFGYAPRPSFQPDLQKAGRAGGVVWFSHTFLAPSSGSVAFTPIARDGSTDPQSIVLFEDSNANGNYDPGEPQLDTARSLSEGEELNLLVKYTIPVTDQDGASHRFSIQADWSYQSTELTDTRFVNDTVIVGDGDSQLETIKEVDKTTARPGETLTYTLTIRNNGTGPVTEIRINDQTPAFSTFLDASETDLPDTLTLRARTTPATGEAGPLEWRFDGELLPNQTAQVQFQIRVD